MMDIGITRMSARGQVVIPEEMRGGMKMGEKLAVIKNGKQIILERVKDLGKNFEEDLEFARRTEEAWKAYDRGEFTSRSAEDFLKELETW